MPSKVRFTEVRRMLEEAGYTLDRIRGSHHVFCKDGTTPIVISVHAGKVKYGYVRSIKKRLEETEAPRREAGGDEGGGEE